MNPGWVKSKVCGHILALLFTFSLNGSDISLGSLYPGDSNSIINRNSVTVQTDEGFQWYLKIRYTSPPEPAPGVTLSYKTSGGAGVGVSGFTVLSGSDSLAYTAKDPDEFTTVGTQIMFSYKATAANNATSGLRTWELIYTLTTIF
jgi:hypothetical protein